MYIFLKYLILEKLPKLPARRAHHLIFKVLEFKNFPKLPKLPARCAHHLKIKLLKIKNFAKLPKLPLFGNVHTLRIFNFVKATKTTGQARTSFEI